MLLRIALYSIPLFSFMSYIRNNLSLTNEFIHFLYEDIYQTIQSSRAHSQSEQTKPLSDWLMVKDFYLLFQKKRQLSWTTFCVRRLKFECEAGNCFCNIILTLYYVTLIYRYFIVFGWKLNCIPHHSVAWTFL